MDMFMDKLAQKLTAQEMIKANMAADAEEMSKLKGKTKEYSEALEQIKKLVEDGVGKLRAAKVDGKEIDRLVEESIAKINEIKSEDDRKDAETAAAVEALKAETIAALEAVKEQLGEKLEASNENVHKECVKVYRNVQAVVVEENNKQTESIKEAVTAAVKGFKGKLTAILIISGISLLLAAGSVALQVMEMLNFKFF
ncbi:MAG: hypothetical protein E7286_07240 [Lachnospiraceae bacterium]|nr:hypothetical protein [Lachnospiraceae bacterium]